MNNLENPQPIEKKEDLTVKINEMAEAIAKQIVLDSSVVKSSVLIDKIKHEAYRDAEEHFVSGNPNNGYDSRSAFKVVSRDVGYMDKVQMLVIDKLKDPKYVSSILQSIKRDVLPSGEFRLTPGDDKYNGITDLQNHLKTAYPEDKVA